MRSDDEASGQKPELHLTDTRKLTFDQVMDLFRKLTGREPTAEEVEDARRRWEAKRRPV